MSELRHLISKQQEKALWKHKDELDILSKDPMGLHKTAFLKYLAAKAEAMYAEAPEDQRPAVDKFLRKLAQDWKAEATRRYHARTA